eukprot:5437870-Amphidinium_carterae.1
MEYVDNLITVSYSQEVCGELLERGVGALRKAGLPVHDIEAPSTQSQVLGWCFDGEAGVVGPTANRAWKLFLALQELEKHPEVSGQQLQRVIGHFTFLALMKR